MESTMNSLRSERLIFDHDLFAQKEYWVSRALLAREASELATDRPRTWRFEHTRDALAIEIAGREYSDLIRLARGGPFLLYTVLMAALKICLRKYTGSQTIAVGSPTLREEAELEQTRNALPIVDQIDDRKQVRQFLFDLRQTLLDAYSRQRYPFQRLIKDLGVDGETYGCPLFSVALCLTEIHTELPEVHNDITITWWKESDLIAGRVDYNGKLFERKTVERFIDYYFNTLRAILSDTNAIIGDVSILGEWERHQLTVEWNDTKTDERGASARADCYLHQLIERRSTLAPDALAVVYGESCLTYDALNRRANQLAHRLIELGCGPDGLVGVCIERSPEMIVAILATQKAGAAYAPLDPAYPAKRLAFMLEDARPHVVLTQEKFIDDPLPQQTHIVCIDRDWKFIAEQRDDDPQVNLMGDNTAYVIYTSGSTGQPKGAVIRHDGLSNLSDAQVRCFGVVPGDRVLQFASLSFDASIFEIVMALRAGAILLIAPPEELLPGPGLIRLLREWQVSNVTLPPSALAALPAAELPALRTIIVAGEACPSELVARWAKDRRFFNAYGPTETTVWASVAECADGSRKPPIGRPIANIQLYVLDEALQLMPVGAPGELYIGGVGLARGYLRRPDLTAERFIPHPYSTELGAQLYKTGDLVRRLPGGDIEYLGRIDHQVKVRGFRIEPGEIEMIIGHYPGVREVAVTAREDVGGGVRLVAYLVYEGQVSSHQLRSHLARSLPDYMSPSAFVFLEKLPLTPNGKIDRKSLPEPAATRPTLEQEHIPPRTQTEEILVAIWSGVLGIEGIGIYDNFSDLGGHSLQATRIMSRVRETFRVEAPLRRLFEGPTIAQLADEIERIKHTTGLPAAPPITPVPARGRAAAPLSHAQRRLWFLSLMASDGSAYNIFSRINMSGKPAIGRLQQCLSEIARRHEILRTRFLSQNGEPQQVIIGAEPIELPVVDLNGLEIERQRQLSHRLARESASRSFSLSHGPVWRICLLLTSDPHQTFMLTMHHIISDGWSMEVLRGEMTVLFEAYRRGAPSPLAELPIQYADFAAWQHQWLQGETLNELIAFWKEKLAGAPPVLELPADHPRPQVKGSRGGHQWVVLPTELTAALNALSREEGVTLFMILLAVYQTLLARYTGRDEIIVGTPTAGRNRVEIEALLGCFINTVILRTELRGRPSFRQLIKRARDVVLEAYAHQDLPFEKLVEELAPERDLSHTPLFQVAMVMQNKIDGLAVRNLTERLQTGSEGRIANFDLTLDVVPAGERIICTLKYDADLFESNRVKRMIEHWLHLLKEVTANPDQVVWDISWLSEPERHQALIEWNDSSASPRPERHICAYAELIAAALPDAIALCDGHHYLSYTALHRRANQLAQLLSAFGEAPDLPIAVCLPRSIDLFVAQLAILKAGSAFLPLDPHYPPDRILLMLEDSRAHLLITSEAIRDELPSLWFRVLCLDAEGQLIDQQPSHYYAAATSPESLAYVIYTSGSTGRPKGVQITRRALLNLCDWHQEQFAVTSADRATQLASPAFDAAVWEAWPYLLCGASLHLVAEADRAQPERLSQWLKQEQITMSFAPTPVAERLLELAWREGSALRILLTGGDRLGRGARAGLSFKVVNNYGPTETTVVATSGEVGEGNEGEVPTIGRGVGNVEVYVVDGEGRAVGIGIPGELWIGGEGLARGYLNDAWQTAERFVPDGMSGRAGRRLYCSGDVARHGANGEVEYIGRIDRQVKLRGYRIELGEAEAALRQVEGVREAVVEIYQASPGEKRLVGYVVWEEGRARSWEEVRAQLSEKLPEYMAPAAYVALERLPLTAHGKVDRRALPAPENRGNNNHTHYLPPRTEIEKTIADVWREVLGIERVGLRDNFFDLGGHSLLMTQVYNRLQELLGQDLTIIDLFRYPTPGALATYLSQGKDGQPYRLEETPAAEETSLNEVKKRQRQLRRARQASRSQEGL